MRSKGFVGVRHGKELQLNMRAYLLLIIRGKLLESMSKAAGWMDAFTRLFFEVGCPNLVFCDRNSAIKSGLEISETKFRDIQLELHQVRGIKFELCGVEAIWPCGMC